MNGKPEDFLMQAWKQQLDASLRFIEILIEGATKLHEVQLEAAADAHADAEATRKSVAAADPSQLLKLQTEWAGANMEKCAAYWRGLYGVAAETQAELVKCLCAQPLAAAPGGDSSKALLGLIDNAYKQWLDTTQQFYKLPAIPTQQPTTKTKQPTTSTRAAA